MELGAFSVSLAVRNIQASKLFYEKLGFDIFGRLDGPPWKGSRTILGTGGMSVLGG